MASSSIHSRRPNNKNRKKNKNESLKDVSSLYTDSELDNTTFVHADPSNFRAVVQKLTGASTDPTVRKLPITISSRPTIGKHNSVEIGPVRPSFKLQERRQNMRNLEIQLNKNGTTHGLSALSPLKRMMDVSPVSTLDTFLARGSPKTPVSPYVHEELAIANKGFYFHPSPLAATRKTQPELLPLFPTSSNS